MKYTDAYTPEIGGTAQLLSQQFHQSVPQPRTYLWLASDPQQRRNALVETHLVRGLSRNGTCVLPVSPRHEMQFDSALRLELIFKRSRSWPSPSTEPRQAALPPFSLPAKSTKQSLARVFITSRGVHRPLNLLPPMKLFKLAELLWLLPSPTLSRRSQL